MYYVPLLPVVKLYYGVTIRAIDQLLHPGSAWFDTAFRVFRTPVEVQLATEHTTRKNYSRDYAVRHLRLNLDILPAAVDGRGKINDM